MRSILLLIVIIALATGGVSADKVGNNYNSSEEIKRRGIWEKNRDTIDLHNAAAAKSVYTFTLGDNPLADMDPTEFKALFGARLLGNYELLTSLTNELYQKCDKVYPARESQLVNCSSNYGNGGCAGGWISYAWTYVKAAPGQARSSVLPYYPAASSTSKYNSTNMKVANVVSYAQLPVSATSIMKTLAAHGPMAIAMLVDGPGVKLYRSGVYSNSTCPADCNDVNHGMVLVGYGTADGTLPYWIVRNSWGPSRGDSGYILVERGVNMCNVECFASP